MRRLLQRVWGLAPESTDLLIELVGRNGRYVVISFVANFISALLEGATLALLALALDSLTSSELSRAGEVAVSIGETLGLGRDGMFVVLVAAAVLAQVFHSALQFVADVAIASLQSKIESTARERIFDQFMDISYAEARKHPVGELSSYMDQVSFLGLAVNRMHEIVSQILLLVVYTGLLFMISWQATIVSTIAMLGVSVIMRKLVRKVRTSALDFRKSLIRVTTQTLEFLNGLRVVHSFGRENFARDRVRASIDECAVSRRRGLIWQATISPSIQSISVCLVGGILIAGFVMYGRSDRSKLVELASFLLVIFRASPKLSVLNKSRGLLAHYLPFFDRVSDLLQLGGKAYGPQGTVAFSRLTDKIEFANVTLIYPDTEVPAVSELKFTLRRGQMVALVGESGAGKTTIADLLLGLYPLTTGQILIDGVPLQDLDWSDWRERIGVVSQDTFLLSGSIRDNIAFGKLDATDDEIQAAATAAHAHEFIIQFQNGYDTVLGEQGYRLSGGQRQRLSIARAILRDPQILILDEATSDLDSNSEALIHESLTKLRANRTVLVIAHRLSTIAAADEILVLRKGQIAERGRHVDLLSSGGTYAQFVKLQTATAPSPSA